MSARARARTEPEGGDALCNELNRLPKEIFDELMNAILKNSSVDACEMIWYIDWQKCGLYHMDLSKEETWFDLMVFIFNQVPSGGERHPRNAPKCAQLVMVVANARVEGQVRFHLQGFAQF